MNSNNSNTTLCCIIIDDEKTARTIISHFCRQIPNLEVLNEFSSAIEAIKFLNEQQVDLIFLDIHMSKFSGMDFVESLKNPPRIIVTTSDTQFAITAFEYDCIVDYLLKPITLSRFEQAVTKATYFHPHLKVSAKEFKHPLEDVLPSNLYINVNNRLIKLEFDKMSVVEAKGDYVYIRTDDKNYTLHTTLKKIAEKLPTSSFLKVHRSFIINIKKIIDIEDNSVLIDDNIVPISRSKRAELMNRLNLL